MEAFRFYSITRLADVIFKLRNRGYDIDTETVRNGSVSFARYRLKQDVTPARLAG